MYRPRNHRLRGDGVGVHHVHLFRDLLTLAGPCCLMVLLIMAHDTTNMNEFLERLGSPEKDIQDAASHSQLLSYFS